jgi:RNA polymerase sigma-70 factor (ECF subfamily)
MSQGRSADRLVLVHDADRPLSATESERFRSLVLPHLDAAYTFARYLTRDPAAAEDLTQDAFVRALRGFRGYAGGEAKAWLLAIVRNAFRDQLRARREDTGEPPEMADPDDPEAILMRKHSALGIRATLEQLPEPFRETLVLRELEELSYKEIAAVTAAPLGTVMSRLARAREMLAALILPAGQVGMEVSS